MSSSLIYQSRRTSLGHNQYFLKYTHIKKVEGNIISISSHRIHKELKQWRCIETTAERERIYTTYIHKSIDFHINPKKIIKRSFKQGRRASKKEESREEEENLINEKNVLNTGVSASHITSIEFMVALKKLLKDKKFKEWKFFMKSFLARRQLRKVSVEGILWIWKF